jgi:two-component system response regulator NreC
MPSPPLASTETIDLVIADDHRLVREGLRLVLEVESDLTVVGEASTPAETEQVLRACQPAVLLLDILMGHDSSLPALQALRAASASTAIVMLTVEADPVVARDTLRRGASGYVAKVAQTVELITAIRSAAAGEIYLDPRLGAQLAVEHPGESDELTQRDIEILRLVALGHTNAEIAERVFLSVRTVEAYRLELQKRLSLSSRAEVVQYTRARRLVG